MLFFKLECSTNQPMPLSAVINSWIECENWAVWIYAPWPGALSVCAVWVGVRQWLTLSTSYSTCFWATWATLTRLLTLFLHVFPSFLLSSPHTDFPSLRVNVGCGPAEERVLLTGLHAVADIYCENCKTTLGWKYVSDLGDFMHNTANCIQG